MEGVRFGFGGTCCRKPVGCTNMSDQCIMKNHKWKRKYAQKKEVDMNDIRQEDMPEEAVQE